MSGGMGGGDGGVSEDLLTTKGDTHGYNTDNARVPIGTNTQVLTADSGEALGLKWADSAGAPTTTKGDVSGFSTSSTRIPIGTNTQVLTADSGEALGLKWATPDTPPTTTKGDLSSFSTVQGRFPVGSNGQRLVADSTQPFGLRWESPSFSSTYGDSNLKTYWKWNVASGVVPNSSESADKLGTDTGVHTLTNVTYGESGIIGDSVLFNNTSSQGLSGTSANNEFNFMHNQSQLFTYNVWFKYTNVVGNDSTFINTTDNGGGGKVGICITKQPNTTNDRQVDIWLYAGASGIDQISTDDLFIPVDTDWHMMTITASYAANAYKFYLDGVLKHTRTRSLTYSNANAAGDMHIGYWNTGGWFDGNFDEEAIWNAVLTDSQITALYNGGSGLAIY